MKRARPKKIRLKKQVKRKRFGAARLGAANPKQKAAHVGRQNRRRRAR